MQWPNHTFNMAHSWNNFRLFDRNISSRIFNGVAPGNATRVSVNAVSGGDGHARPFRTFNVLFGNNKIHWRKLGRGLIKLGANLTGRNTVQFSKYNFRQIKRTPFATPFCHTCHLLADARKTDGIRRECVSLSLSPSLEMDRKIVYSAGILLPKFPSRNFGWCDLLGASPTSALSTVPDDKTLPASLAISF